MKKQRFYVFLFIVGCTLKVQAQTDSIQVLDEVVLSDVKLKRYAKGFKVTVLNDSVIAKNAASLTDLLRFNSNIYFKENGYGMVSSPSFRGTNASHTAVIWNGININSQLNGQVDFNTITTSNYNSIEIRSGGGSVQYGSGAIGGSVHLNNKLTFSKHFKNKVDLLYGSFNTKSLRYSMSAGGHKWSSTMGVSYVDSDNDYDYLGLDESNENGAYKLLNLNANVGYFVTAKDVLKFYHQSFLGDRNLSGTIVAPSRNKYKDRHFRSLIEWGHFSKTYSSKLRIAHLFEEFKYFENKDTDSHTLGKVRSLIANHNLDFRLSDAIRMRTILEYTNLEGEGSSFGEPSRNSFSATALLSHQLGKDLSYGINIRKDVTSGFSSPFIFSFDTKVQLSKHYTLKFNGSKNYRVPTFNDLYWQPGGNLDLVPESSYQADFGQEFLYKSVGLKLNVYYIKTTDMIQWKPDSSGFWSPVNVNKVRNYGVETEVFLKHQIKKHLFEFNANYSYTVSEDLETEKQLIYVPFHKANANLSYAYKAFSMYYQHLFNGEVYKIGGKLKAHDLGNLGMAYAFNTSNKIEYYLDVKINNIYNNYYENVALRPMPNRNYQLQLTLKF